MKQNGLYPIKTPQHFSFTECLERRKHPKHLEVKRILQFCLFYLYLIFRRPVRDEALQTCSQLSWSDAATPAASSAVKMFPRPWHFSARGPPRSGRRVEDGLSSAKEERGMNQSSQAVNAITRESMWKRSWAGNVFC